MAVLVAEVEADVAQLDVNNSFALFFPEKRPFFLEGADIFDFGLGLTSDLDVLPFFSRRIGLLAGREVPIDVALREGGDIGRPLVATAPESAAAQAFIEMARKLS